MRFKGLDLNLLHAFDILLAERSVSRAAIRLHLSQSAVSAALMRLRDFFGDPLLELRGKRMNPTPFAYSLHPLVRACLAEAEAVVGINRVFDPQQSKRRFQCAASDYAMAAILADFTVEISRKAPHVGFDFVPPGERASQLFERGEIDLMLTPETYLIENHPGECLFEDRHVVVGSSSHPLFDGTMTEEAILGLDHVAVTLGEGRTLSFGDWHLARLAPGRRVVMTMPSFASIPWLLVGTRKLAIVPELLAIAFCRHLPLRFAPTTFAIPPLREYVQHSRSRSNDDGLVWLMNQLKEFLRLRNGNAVPPV